MPQPPTDTGPLRALVIGGGSIGQRHASVLTGLGAEVALVSARTDLEAPVYRAVSDAVRDWHPAYAVVATETAGHLDSIRALQGAGFTGRLLVEKPLGFSAHDIDLDGFAEVGVGFNLRFHPVLRALEALTREARIHTVAVSTGQALDTWRPGRDVRAQYSASRARGGGVLRDLSHELDYLRWLFGDVRGLFARGGRLTEITVDADDAWAVILESERAPLLSLQLNYLETPPRRQIVVTSSVGTIEADLVASTIRHNGVLTEYPTPRDTTYRDMHASMLGGSFAGARLPDALAVEAMIDTIEKSAENHEWLA